MTERLYYSDSFLFDFDATVVEVAPTHERLAVILDRTAFYPTSGGQLFDTGRLIADGRELPVIDVIETEEGDVAHYLTPSDEGLQALTLGARVRGKVDAARRLDHIQQHTGQHVLSAAFVRLFQMPTVSFHMGRNDAACTIDLDTPSLAREQFVAAERLANQVVLEDRAVEILNVSLDQARSLGVRKLPERGGPLRLIDVRDFDLTACGGTHVRHTGQIGAILLRKIEKVRQGMRVEFVCGMRAVAVARRDYETLTDTAEQLSTHIWELPAQMRKTLDEARVSRKREQRLLEEIAELEAARLLSETASETAPAGRRVVSAIYAERDAGFIKLLAHKLVATSGVAAVLGAGAGQPAVVLAQSEVPPGGINAGQLLREALSEAGGRGGGTKEMAQGGLPDSGRLQTVVDSLADKLRR